MIDVIIPARNEADTIGPIVAAFAKADYINQVIVVANGPNPVPTGMAATWEGAVVRTDNTINGKGEAIELGLQWVETENVILCDGDLKGLTPDHIRQFAHEEPQQVIGVPDWPGRSPVPWRVRMDAFAQMSGQRCLPAKIVRSIPLHGYTVEVLLNRAAERAEITTIYKPLKGVTGKVRDNRVRMAELRRDWEWLAKNW